MCAPLHGLVFGCVCVCVLLNFDISNRTECGVEWSEVARCNLCKNRLTYKHNNYKYKYKANAKNLRRWQHCEFRMRHISMKKVQTYGKSAHN